MSKPLQLPAWLSPLVDLGWRDQVAEVERRLRTMPAVEQLRLSDEFLDSLAVYISGHLASIVIKIQEQQDPSDFDAALRESRVHMRHVLELNDRYEFGGMGTLAPDPYGLLEAYRLELEDLRGHPMSEAEARLHLLEAWAGLECMDAAMERVADARQQLGSVTGQTDHTKPRGGQPYQGGRDITHAIARAVMTARDRGLRRPAARQQITFQVFEALGAPEPGSTSIETYWSEARRAYRRPPRSRDSE